MRNYDTRPGLSRPTMAAKIRVGGQLSPYTSHVIGGRD
jgi:hypothetical protein